jgi:hypothetical protein
MMPILGHASDGRYTPQHCSGLSSGKRDAMDLSSMMGLVVDEVRREPPNRPTDIARGALREIGQLRGQPVGAETFGPAHDLRIEVDPLALEPIPIGIQ